MGEVKPTKCGECKWFVKTVFEEDGALAIGSCSFLPISATRRFEDEPCGILPILLQIMEDECSK